MILQAKLYEEGDSRINGCELYMPPISSDTLRDDDQQWGILAQQLRYQIMMMLRAREATDGIPA